MSQVTNQVTNLMKVRWGSGSYARWLPALGVFAFKGSKDLFAVPEATAPNETQATISGETMLNTGCCARTLVATAHPNNR